MVASNANLPREMLEKEFCVRFVTSSPNVSPMELMRSVKESILNASQEGIRVFDCINRKEVILRPYALFFPGDNPMQAEHCSQAGLGCNYFCRTCKVGGTRAFKASDEGFALLFLPGVQRTVDETKMNIQGTLNLLVTKGAQKKVQTAVATHGTRDSLTTGAVEAVISKGKAMQKKNKDLSETQILAELKQELSRHAPEINPLLNMPGIDIHQDTPTEILHTVLLGVVKYFWGQTIVILKKARSMDVFQAHLASVNSDGLNIPKICARYMCMYSGSLIGKHFKTIAQVMEFTIYDLVPKDVLQAWRAIRTLVSLLWYTEILDVPSYISLIL
ncbi:hypothetical protein M407DRAFT_15855 [Tulasnella calospora MUT 4182]|uniref:Uncharacterized protein n=1 Tax=Tulasnella calospora MUT 4182 TaxID=1051891 RepID=A0A0C3KI04_9AGAM|nr:hypothetical protein M407DRAFT_15855 [Tulasnella calospora MUT 4182]